MSKEMIISVNGREKKIAILDNGQVTEYYIERGGEENTGVVGNIYKGRVMRVLPGMQSAFVNIGLERDGFLYVSDFFDEEEEIERIVMEKSKESSAEEAEREATDHVQRSRLKREKQMEDVQELAEPIAESSADDDAEEDSDKDNSDKDKSKNRRKKTKRGRRSKDQDQEKEDKQENDKKEEQKEDKQEESSKDKSGRNRGRSQRRSKSEKEDSDDEKQEIQEKEERKERELRSAVGEVGEIDFEEFEEKDSDFERIIDDSETGELFKDAYMQEAIIDQVRAIEFDMASPEQAEVGSLLDSLSGDSNGFERIADEDEETEKSEKPAKRGRKSRGGRKSAKKKADDEAENKTAADEDQTDSAESAENEKETDKPKRKRTSRAKKGTAKKTSAAKSKKSAEDEADEAESADEKSSKSKSRGRKKTSRSKKTADDEKLEDGEASVKEENETAEMAVRRGGRGRRGSSNRDSKSDDNDSKDSKKSGGGRRSGGRRSNQSSQPKITDLLNEGQEILVQIAKEPIAKKGARITSHIALPGRFIVYMPTIEHLGVSRKIESAKERNRLRNLIQKIKDEVDLPSGGFIVRTAGAGISEEDLAQDAKYLLRTWYDIRKEADKAKSPELVHQDLDIIQRLLRDHLSDEFAAIRVDSEDEYLRTVEFINRIQPKMVKRVKFYTREKPILEAFGVQEEVDKALKPRVWLKSGGYLVINQTEALVAIDVNTGKFVGKGNARLEDTITKTNMEAVGEIARQIRLRDLGGIIVLDLIDMEDRRNRHKVLQTLQESLASDKSPTKVLSFNDFGLIIMTRKRVKQSLERTMCAPCDYCEGAGWVKSPQTICYEILEEARSLAKNVEDVRQTTLRVHPDVAEALRDSESGVLDEIEEYLGNVDVTGDNSIHQEQFDFAFV